MKGKEHSNAGSIKNSVILAENFNACLSRGTPCIPLPAILVDGTVNPKFVDEARARIDLEKFPKLDTFQRKLGDVQGLLTHCTLCLSPSSEVLFSLNTLS